MGYYSKGAWNFVFLGCEGAPESHCGTDGSGSISLSAVRRCCCPAFVSIFVHLLVQTVAFNLSSVNDERTVDRGAVQAR